MVLDIVYHVRLHTSSMVLVAVPNAVLDAYHVTHLPYACHVRQDFTYSYQTQHADHAN
jgi:hypothetical protein